MTGYAERKKKRRRESHPPALEAGDRRVYDVWTQPTVADVYAQLKVAETMLSRICDPNLAIVKREMYILEDMMWQFISG
jgi:hypothetical protein